MPTVHSDEFNRIFFCHLIIWVSFSGRSNGVYGVRKTQISPLVLYLCDMTMS